MPRASKSRPASGLGISVCGSSGGVTHRKTLIQITTIRDTHESRKREGQLDHPHSSEMRARTDPSPDLSSGATITPETSTTPMEIE